MLNKNAPQNASTFKYFSFRNKNLAAALRPAPPSPATSATPMLSVKPTNKMLAFRSAGISTNREKDSPCCSYCL